MKSKQFLKLSRQKQTSKQIFIPSFQFNFRATKPAHFRTGCYQTLNTEG